MPELAHSFVRILITDVIEARTLLSSADSSVNRRNLVRTTLAGVEGLAWYFREHVREVAGEMGQLTPLAALALREQSYTVTDQGEISEQVRYLALATSIRLMIKQAQQIVPLFEVDISGTGWQQLRDAIAIRHRITHPKVADDLQISNSDLAAVNTGFQ